MSDLMKMLYEYAQSRRVAGFIDCRTYGELERLETKTLTELKKNLSSEQSAALERYQDACQEQRFIDMEAMFLAGFSIARELFI